MTGPDLLFGPLLLGALFAVLLFGVLAAQALTFFLRSAAAPGARGTTALVVYLLAAAAAALVVEAGSVYEPLVARYGTIAAATQIPTLLPGTPLLAVLIALPVQLFAAARVHALTKARVAPAGIALLSLVAAGAGLAFGASLLHASLFADLAAAATRVPAAVWLGAGAACDVLLAGALAHALLTRTPHAGYAAVAVQAGAPTALMAVLDLVLGVASPKTALRFAAAFPRPMLYVCSLLALLNARPRAAPADTETAPRTLSFSEKPRSAGSTSSGSSSSKAGTLVYLHAETFSPEAEAATPSTTRDDGYASFYSYDGPRTAAAGHKVKRSTESAGAATSRGPTPTPSRRGSTVTLAPAPPPKRRSQLPAGYTPAPASASPSPPNASRRGTPTPELSAAAGPAYPADAGLPPHAQFPAVPGPPQFPPAALSPLRTKVALPTAPRITIPRATGAPGQRWQWADASPLSAGARTTNANGAGAYAHRSGARSHDLRRQLAASPPAVHPAPAPGRVRAASSTSPAGAGLQPQQQRQEEEARSPAPSFSFAETMLAPASDDEDADDEPAATPRAAAAGAKRG